MRGIGHVAGMERMEEDAPHPRVFWQKRLQTIEKKGRECAKERKEKPKRLQTAENMGFATEAQRHRVGEIEVHAHDDERHALLVEGGGDRGAAWRVQLSRLGT
jgi:hypothetical protein